MFNVTLDAVLLIVLLLGLLGDYAAVLIDRVLELAVVLGLGDREVAPNESHSIESTLDLLSLGDVATCGSHVPVHWSSEREAFHHVSHKLLLSPHRDGTGF